ncbi:AAA family ATPase [Brevibacterium salitolerans]|uniref:AAA+ ATPase domain-containing protein n=1 Tax=Brevibacterium salitolerans TaxID=1403566 RepID=A0ABN2WIQ8_9MICO
MDFDQPPVVSVRHSEDAAPASGTWPMTVPAVAQILAEGLRLDHGVTFLVGENGSGKSTIVEGIAEAYGLNPEGGSTHARHVTRRTESPLAEWLLLQRGAGKRRWGFFLRAETMHSLYTYMESVQGPADPQFHQLSHGESFNALLDSRFTRPGFYCLDEPEAALSFSSTLPAAVHAQRARGSGRPGPLRHPFPDPRLPPGRADPRGGCVGSAGDRLGAPRARTALEALPGIAGTLPPAPPR